jgi:hypothetical protein
LAWPAHGICWCTAQELPGEIDADHGERHALERRVALQAGIAHHDVQRAERADRALEQCLHVGLAAHVGA